MKIHLDLDTNMKMVGKRFPYYATYKVTLIIHCTVQCDVVMSQVGFTDDGVINGIVMDVYTNSGCHNNDQACNVAMFYIDNGN